MTHSIPLSGTTIDRANSVALRVAIGERLQDSLDESMALPPFMASLLQQMRLSEVPVDPR